MNYDQKVQLLIIGDSTVGKTSILSRFTNGTFDSNYLATVGLDNFTKDDIIDNKTIRIKIWDTAGQERYRSLTKGFFRNADGIMLVYDVTNSDTYDNLKFWLQSIKNNMSADMGEIPIIIIGNKIDCTEEREVNFQEAENFWKEQGFSYFETSVHFWTFSLSLRKKNLCQRIVLRVKIKSINYIININTPMFLMKMEDCFFM